MEARTFVYAHIYNSLLAFIFSKILVHISTPPKKTFTTKFHCTKVHSKGISQDSESAYVKNLQPFNTVQYE